MSRTTFVERFFASLGFYVTGQPKVASRSHLGASHRRRLKLEALESRSLLSVTPGALISGTAFSNLNLGGLPSGQPAVQGITVDLYKDGGNGTFDGGTGAGADDSLVGSPVITDASGHFSFSVATAGTYFIKEVTPTGFIPPSPIKVTVTAGDLLGATETTVDGFTTPQSVLATPANPTQGSSQAATEALGGHRDLAVQLTSASGEVLLTAAPSFDTASQHLLHFDTLSNGGTGTFTVAWDGANPNTPPTINANGLGNVNLAAGNATGFSVVLGADHDGTTATFKIYKDATDWSTVTVPVPGPGAGVTASNPNQLVYIPFSSFTTGAGSGAGDFSKVGAVVLQVVGTTGGLNGQIGPVTAVAPTPKTVNLANTPEADLQITKTDNKTSVVPGTQDTYTIVVTNAGPNAVSGVSVKDNFPGTFTSVTYTATATGGATGFSASGSGSSLNQTVNMPVGSTITYTVTGLVSATATGTLSNTANVTAPTGVTDPTPGNNIATDTDTLTPQADLQITKTDNKTSVVPGIQDTYTIVVTNAGPSAVTGASVTDSFPSTFTNVTYAATATGGATGFSASGSGSSLNQTVSMPVGSTITYMVTGLVSATASGTLSNTANVTAPNGVTDPTPGNNVATDIDTLTPQADLQITKTDNKTTIVPGTQDTYTIVVTNAGPSAISGASIADNFPGTFTNVTYTATATGGATGFLASGSGSSLNQSVNMPVGSTITYTLTGLVSAAATGTLANTATVTAPNGTTDPTPGNNVATDTDTLTPQADLQITKTDNKTSVVPGTQDTYTIVVSNVGPSAASGASVVDNFPGTFTNVTYTATATGGASGFSASGSGSSLNQSVNLPVGSTITYTVTGLVSAAATGTLSNTATVTAPNGVTDPTPGNNVATDTDTLTPQADLQITKTDNTTSVVPGTQDTYTVVVTNAGPSAVTGASIADNFPSTFTNVTYTATATGGASGFSASGSGSSLSQTVNMPVGSTITYTVTGLVSATASGTLSNTASVTAPNGVTDPTPGNNVATDTDTVTPQADLQITKTDNKTSVVPGTQDTYTIVVTNAGPSAVTGASVADNFPSSFTNVTYTATATGGATGFTASGSGGSLNQTVNMPVGSTITYTVTGLVSVTASGTLSNTASVTVPEGVTDPTPGNNIATDTDALTPQADLQITKTDNKTSVVPGTQDTYTIVVTNAGLSPVTGASVVDNFPSTFTNVTYTATATGGATGFTASGSGSSLNQTVNMPVGSTITYTVTGLVSSSAVGNLTNSASVTAPLGITDPTPGNNVATDTDTLTPQADLQITKTDNRTSVVPGTPDTYTIVVTNAGPSDANSPSVVDYFPSTFTNVSYTATGTGGASGYFNGSGGAIIQTVNLPAGATITYTVTGIVSSAATGTLSNTATVNAPNGLIDPTPSNNVAIDTDTLTPQADLQITKTDNTTSVNAGNQDTYTIVVTNAGPSNVTGASIVDYFPSSFTNVSYTATGTGGATGYFNASAGAIIQTVNLPAGATITYLVTGTVSSSATGTLINTATVNSPLGVTDPTMTNNVATDTDTVVPVAPPHIVPTTPPLSKSQFLGKY